MKKLFIFCNCIFITFCISAQNTPVKNNPGDNFCNTLLKVIAQAPGQFEKIKTGGYLEFRNPDAGWLIGKGWVASLNFPGAFLSRITQYENSPNIYSAYFGTYQSQAEAQKKAYAIKNQLSACLPGFTVVDRANIVNSFREYPINFVFIEKKKGTSPQQIVNLYLVKDSSLHNIYLQIIGSDVNGTVLERMMKKPVSKDSQDSESEKLASEVLKGAEEFENIFGQIFKDLGIRNDIDQTKLTKQLVELLKYAETKFETIKGEKNLKESITNEFQTSVVYETNYQLEGAVKNRIEDFDRKRYYDATYLENANEDAATSLFNDLFTKIKSGLGDTFNYEKEESISDEGKKFKISLKKESTHFIRFRLAVKEELSMEKDELGYLSTKTKKKWSVKILVF